MSLVSRARAQQSKKEALTLLLLLLLPLPLPLLGPPPTCCCHHPLATSFWLGVCRSTTRPAPPAHYIHIGPLWTWQQKRASPAQSQSRPHCPVSGPLSTLLASAVCQSAHIPSYPITSPTLPARPSRVLLLFSHDHSTSATAAAAFFFLDPSPVPVPDTRFSLRCRSMVSLAPRNLQPRPKRARPDPSLRSN